MQKKKSHAGVMLPAYSPCPWGLRLEDGEELEDEEGLEDGEG